MARVLSVGEMRSHAFLIDNDYKPSGAGFMDDWKNSELKAMCSLVAKSYSKTMESGAVVFVSSYTMYCYAHPELMQKIDRDKKWIIDGEVYTINGFDRYQNNSFYLTFNLNKDGSI